MKITGLETLVFGVDDVRRGAVSDRLRARARQRLRDGGRFEALDGTAVVIARRHPRFPRRPRPAPAAQDRDGRRRPTLDAIEAELRRDREVRRRHDGSLESVDNWFRAGLPGHGPQAVWLAGEITNAPGGAASGRSIISARGPDASSAALPLARGLFCTGRAEGGGFYVTPRLPLHRPLQSGALSAAAGTLDHHTLFLIGTRRSCTASSTSRSTSVGPPK